MSIAAPAELRVAYEIGLADLDALAARNAESSLRPALSPPYVAGALMRGTLAFFLFADLLRIDVPWAALAGVAVGGLFWAWAPRRARALFASRTHARLAEPGSRFLLGPRTLELDAEGFAVLGPQSEFRCKWSALQRVVETPERLFFYVTSFTAQVIPLSPPDASKVLEVIRRHAPSAFETRTTLAKEQR